MLQQDDGEFILDRLSQEIKQKIKNNKLIIAYEKQEILKAEALLLKFQQSLLDQNHELNILKIEGGRLEEEISKAVQNGERKSVNNKYTNENNIKEIGIEKNQLQKKNLEIDNAVSGLNDKAYEQRNNNNDNHNAEGSSLNIDKYAQPNYEIILNKMEIPNLKNMTINTITSRSDCGIFLGGCDGFLMRYFENETHIYETNIKDDIIQVELMKMKRIWFLIVFTREKILIFENVTDNKPKKEINLSGMSIIFNEGNVIYITLEGGLIKKLNKTNWVIADYPDNNYSTNRCFFPSTINNRFILLTLQDTLLYKTEHKNLTGLEVVRGLSNVKMILRVKGNKHLCYSNKMIWFLNRDCEIIDAVPFLKGIKFVDRDNDVAVVVDCKNVVYVYPILMAGNFGKKCDEKSIQGDITAMAIESKIVYIAVGDVIFNFSCNL